jgi:hypothetical protein
MIYKIVAAHKKKQKFKIFIVIPLLPEYATEISTK